MKSESGPAWPPGIAAACSSAWSPPPGPSITFCVVYLTSNALPPLSLLPNPAHRARHRSNPTWQQLSEVSLTSSIPVVLLSWDAPLPHAGS